MNKKVDAIYPLTALQKALLFHNLSSEKDQGVLHIQFDLVGEIELPAIQEAIKLVFQSFETLRASIHWKEVKEPVMVIRNQSAIEYSRLFQPKTEWNEKKLQLESAPISQLFYTKVSEDVYHIDWYCHHITLDGWSSMIVIEQIANKYREIIMKQSVHPIQQNFLSEYYDWLKNRDLESAKTFWVKEFEGLNDVNQKIQLSGEEELRREDIQLSQAMRKTIEELAVNLRVPVNAVYQAGWAICLAWLNDTHTPLFGITVSGRSHNIYGIESAVGLFSNTVPFGIHLGKQELESFIKEVQNQMLKIGKYEFVQWHELSNWLASKGINPSLQALFTFENFPTPDLEFGEVKIENFKGDFTSSFPLNVVIIPDKQLVSFFYAPKIFSEVNIVKLKMAYQYFLTNLTNSKSVSTYLDEFHSKWGQIKLQSVEESIEYAEGDAVVTTSLEIQIMNIWERLLERKNIGVHQNFFDLGGKSLQAIQFCQLLKNKIGVDVSPNLLIQAPTIRTFARKVEEHSSTQTHYTSILPFQSTGPLPPLFCFHAGGGHVFFYRDLAAAMTDDQPVYAVHPLDKDGMVRSFDTIQAMAASYLSDIQKIYSEGPLLLLGYCFSDPICVEIARLIDNDPKCKLDPHIIIVDSGPIRPKEKASLSGKMNKVFEIINDRSWDRLRFIVRDKIDSFKQRFGPRLRVHLEEKPSILDTLYRNYNWSQFDRPIFLIRSSQFARRSDKEIEVNEWKRLAKSVEIKIIPGNHDQLFSFPNVNAMSKIIHSYSTAIHHSLGRLSTHE